MWQYNKTFWRAITVPFFLFKITLKSWECHGFCTHRSDHEGCSTDHNVTNENIERSEILVNGTIQWTKYSFLMEGS